MLNFLILIYIASGYGYRQDLVDFFGSSKYRLQDPIMYYLDFEYRQLRIGHKTKLSIQPIMNKLEILNSHRQLDVSTPNFEVLSIKGRTKFTKYPNRKVTVEDVIQRSNDYHRYALFSSKVSFTEVWYAKE